jgi:hypothetical protein
MRVELDDLEGREPGVDLAGGCVVAETGDIRHQIADEVGRRACEPAVPYKARALAEGVAG